MNSCTNRKSAERVMTPPCPRPPLGAINLRLIRPLAERTAPIGQVHLGKKAQHTPASATTKRKQSTQPTGSNNHNTQLPAHLHILIIEDDPLDQAISYAAARHLDCRTEIVKTAEQAISRLRNTDEHDFFDLVLIDYLLPDNDGVTVARQIKEHLGLKNPPPTVLLSALRKDEIVKPHTGLATIDAYLNKPLSPNKLFDVVTDIIDEKAWQGEEWPQQSRSFGQLISNLRVLLVEDNPVNQKTAEALLAKRGIDVTTANNGQEAVEIIEASSPGAFDIVLMDLDMPVMDGLCATQNIIQHATYKDLPIIALTSRTELDTKRRCMQIGMRNYITKPIHPNALYEALVQEMSLRNIDPFSSYEQ